MLKHITQLSKLFRDQLVIQNCIIIVYRVSREQLSPTAHDFRQSGATSFERGQMPTQGDGFKDGTNSS